MEQKKYASGQALAGNNPVSIPNNKSSVFRGMWCRLVQSPLYLIFAICLTNAMVTAVSEVWGILSPALKVWLFDGNMTAALESDLYAGLGASLILLVPGILSTVGVWLIFKEARDATDDEIKTRGLTLIIWVHRVLLGLVIVAFFFTLPAFTEWMPYDSANDTFLQLGYIAFIIMGLFYLALVVLAQKIREKLSIWCTGEGPLMALAVVFMAIYGVLTYAIFAGELGLSYLPVLEASVAFAILLFKYREMVAKIR